MASLGDLMVRVGANIEEFQTSMAQASAKLGEFAQEADKTFAGFKQWGQNLSEIGLGLSAALTVPIAGFGAAAIQAAGKMEQATVGFTTLLHSGEAATQMLNNLKTFALKTPFDFPELVTAAQRLMAMGTSAKDVIPRMTAISDAVSALGKGMPEFDRIALAYSQMSNSAKLSAQDMRQFTEVGIKAWKYLSDATGIAAGDIQEKAKDVLTGAQAADIILKAMARDFAGASIAQSQTMLGMWTNVKEAITLTLADIGATMLPLAKQVVGDFITPTLNAVRDLAGWFSQLPKPVQETALVMAGLAAAAGPLLLVIGGMSMGFGSLMTAISTVSPVVAALAMQTVPAAVAAMTTFATVTLPAAVSALGTFSTSLLTGAISSLTTFATVTLPAAIAALYTFATTALPAAISGLTTFATSTLPAAISGLTAFATGGIGAAIAGLRTMATAAIPAVVGALSTLTVAALAVGSAFVGWKIGEALLANIPALERFNAAIGDLVMKIPLVNSLLERMSGITATNVSSTDMLQKKVDQVTKALAEKGIVVQRGAASLEQYAAKLNKVYAENLKTNKSEVDAKAAIEARQKAQKQADAELEAAQKVLTETKRLYKEGAASQEDVAAALARVQEAAKKAHPELHATGESVGILSQQVERYRGLKFDEELLKHYLRMDDLRKGILDAGKQMIDLDLDVSLLQRDFANLGHALDAIPFNFKAIVGEANAVKLQFSGVTKEAAKMADALGDAFKRQGITSSSELRKAAQQAKADYEMISHSAQTTQGEVEASWVAMTKAEIAYRRSLGEDVSKLEAELAKYENAHKNHSQKVKTIWQQMSESLKSIGQNFVRGLSDILVGAIWGNKQNAELDRQAEDLRNNLAERTAEWEKYQVDVAAEMEKLRQSSAEDLAKQEADLIASLDSRRSEYDRYVIDVADQIQGLRQKHADEAAKEIADLEATLAEKSADYERYQTDIYRQIDELREANARDLDRELADLQTALRDRSQEYNDYVTDVNTQLSRIGEDSKERVEDETRATKRKVDDKIKQYKREEEDTLTRIDRLKKAGKGENDEEVQDLRKALARKKEDLDEYIAQATEDLADFTDDQKREEKRQTDDLNEELEQRKRDFGQYVDENAKQVAETTASHKADLDKQTQDLLRALDDRRLDLDQFRIDTEAKIAEVTATHKAALDKEEADLQASLEARKAELDAYKAEVAGKLEDLRTTTAAKLADELADLRKSLDDKKAEYDKYKEDIASKLEDIKNQHQTIWGQIKDLIVGENGVLAQIAKSFSDIFLTKIGGIIADFISKHLGSLLGALGELLSVIPGIGDLLGKVFSGASVIFGGGGGSGGASIPGAPTGGSGMGGGGTGGGLAAVGSTIGMFAGGPIGAAIGAAIGGAVEFFTNLFQGMHTNTDLGRIEENTRQISVATWQTPTSLAPVAYGSMLRLGFIHDRLVDLRDALFDPLSLGLNRIGDLIEFRLLPNMEITWGRIANVREALFDPISTGLNRIGDILDVRTPLLQPAGVATSSFYIDLRGATISDQETAEKLARTITEKIRSIAR